MTNTIKTFLLLGILSVIFISLGGFFGGRDGITAAFIFSLLINGGMYFFADKLALSMSRAKPMPEQNYRDIYQMVRELSKKMDLPMPKLFITPEAQANAFATGRGPGNASVAVTEGILGQLTKEELKAVLAHELAHVKNRDILISTIAAVLASSVSFVSNMAMYGGFGGNDDDDNRGSTGVLGIFVALLVPIAASVVQMAISRQREFGADESGARTLGTGEPLAKALLAIHDSANRYRMNVNPATASLYIGNPMAGSASKMLHLFSTHPPVEERVKRLRMLN